MNIINGNIVAPKGFKATGNHIGIKKIKKDLALIVSDVPAICCGMFTTNIVKAAPVLYDMDVLSKGNLIRGLVINSGNANSCTGEQGEKDTLEMANTLGDLLGTSGEKILVFSTGVIGVKMPMEVVNKGIVNNFEKLGNNFEDGENCVEAIMTTDTFKKKCAVTIELGGKTVTVAGIAKGSGMIHPNMATMLSFITTDADINKELLQEALKTIVEDTYNMTSVDGDTSTNDSIVVMANGEAKNIKITEKNEDYEIFYKALYFVNKTLAIEIIKDGEGATKLMEVMVQGAKSEKDAKQMVKGIISSSLVKSALFGADANWGRVLCAMGYSGGEFDTSKVKLSFKSNYGEINLIENGNPIKFDEVLAKNILLEKEIVITITLRDGTYSATGWGCDLTYDYVKINGDYRS